jgi:hypothetical protein
MRRIITITGEPVYSGEPEPVYSGEPEPVYSGVIIRCYI